MKHKLLGMILFSASCAFAEVPVEKYLTGQKCHPTKHIKHKYQFDTTEAVINDLTRHWSPYFSNPQKTIIFGRVLDQKCLPITGAKVQIWQEILGVGKKNKAVETGIAVTNNLGEFVFFSYPISYFQGDVMKTNFAVVGDEFAELKTVISFDSSSSIAKQQSSLDEPALSGWNSFAAHDQHQVYNINLIVSALGNHKRF